MLYSDKEQIKTRIIEIQERLDNLPEGEDRARTQLTEYIQKLKDRVTELENE